MRVCIVGGGKVGYYLAKTLLEHGHTPVLIEDDPAMCRKVADSLDLTVVCGDGTFAEVQESADVAHCSAMVAVTGRDEDNLIVCQLAKQVFKVKRTVARVNNPKNAAVLKKLGVDIAVSATDNLTHLIEREVETAAIQQLLSLAGGTASLTEVLIPQGFAHAGKTLAELVIPKDAVVISITRDGELIVPRGNTQILVNDKVVVLAKNTAFHELAQSWNLADVKEPRTGGSRFRRKGRSMEFSVPRHGAAIVSGWCAALGAMLCLPFWKNFFTPTLAVFLLWLAACFGVLAPRLASSCVRVGGNHLTLRRGLLFPVTRRIPLRFLAGCHIVQTPLQRMTGTCLFFLYSSGCTTLVPGMRKADAECLSAKLTHGGKLL